MLETFSTVSSSFFLDVNISVPYTEEICCPIPRRAISHSSVFVPWASSKKRRRSSTNLLGGVRPKETADWEATQELQEILLLSQIPLDSSVDEDGEDSASVESESDPDGTTTTDESTTPCSLLSRIPHLVSFDPTCSPVKPRKHSNQFMRDAFIDVSSESLLSLSESDSFRKSSGDYSTMFMGRGPKAQRPKLGSSTSNLSEAVFVKERSKPVITPPVRSQNPLPRNSSFNNRKAATRGPEFGLLSVSPPRADDEETLLRRARVKSQKKSDPFNNKIEPFSLALSEESENTRDPSFPTIVNSDVIGNQN